MNADELASNLRSRMEQLGWSVSELAEKAQCRLLDVNAVLAGDPSSKVQTLLAVATALSYVVIAVPEPLRRGIGDGFAPTEPKVETLVAKALRQAKERAAASREHLCAALFCDLDGLVHAAGDSRIDADGQLVGESLFRWWPQLEAVLDDFPDVRVVVHSSWRKYWPTIESLRSLLPPAFAERVADITNPEVLDRQDSVNEYLLDHPEVVAWVILDDAPAEFDVDCAQLIACNPKRGLSDKAVIKKLREVLGHAAKQVDAAKSSVT